ncbi:MAG: M28 family peptidase [Anaerolineales bacterium]
MPGEITTQDAEYALDIVKKICAEVGPGLPGTSQERQRAEVIKKELETHLGTGNVAVEEFICAPDAFLSTYPGTLCMLLAVVLNISAGQFTGISPWIPSIAAVVFAILAPLMFILEFLFSLEVFDPLFPKKKSLNIIGSLRKPESTDVKRLLILSGHHDSAPENTWLRYTGIGFYILSAIYFIGLITLLVMCLIQLAGLILGNEAVVAFGTIGWVLLVFPIVPAMIYVLLLNKRRKNGGIVPGAADNLSACAVSAAMCRFLVENPASIPDDTEIRFITFGCEEAGLRGSRRYVERHLDELKRLDARVLNYEIIAHPIISILTSDVNGTVKNSPEMVKSVVAAAERSGVPYKIGAATIGAGSDAAPFSRVGLKALTLLPFKVPQQQFAFYHQDRDTPEVLSIEPLLNTLKLTLEWIRGVGEDK